MTRRPRLAEALLWVFVIVFSLQMGAGLYEMRVVTPLWSSDLPHSVREWNAERHYTLQPRAEFWRYCTPALGLSAIGALVAGWVAGWGIGERRKKRLLAATTLSVIAMIILTYIYFAPTLAALLDGRGEGLSDEEIRRRANQWLVLSWMRAAIYVAAWIGALKALAR